MAIDFITGVLQIANFFLAIVAGIFSASLFAISGEKDLKAWKPLAIALVLLAAEEIFGGLRSFNIYSNPWITHIIPSFILGFLIYAIAVQIHIVSGGRR